MGQILHTDIWPFLTSAEVNIRVAYEQKENIPIPKYITWNNSITKHSHIHLNNHVKYASWNERVLVRDLKMSRDGDRLMLRGRSFHSIPGPLHYRLKIVPASVFAFASKLAPQQPFI